MQQNWHHILQARGMRSVNFVVWVLCPVCCPESLKVPLCRSGPSTQDFRAFIHPVFHPRTGFDMRCFKIGNTSLVGGLMRHVMNLNRQRVSQLSKLSLQIPWCISVFARFKGTLPFMTSQRLGGAQSRGLGEIGMISMVSRYTLEVRLPKARARNSGPRLHPPKSPQDER